MSKQNMHIAVIVSTIDEEYQSGILDGIRQYAFANRITVEHFVAFGNIGGDIGHDTGEYNIFSLADFTRFDGVILVINTVSGMAMAVAAAIDAMNWSEVAGCIAGDDTIFCAVHSEDETVVVMDKLRKMVN